MTGEHRGIFFHGEREECQGPRWSLSELSAGVPLFIVEEITPEGCLIELESWPEAVEQARKIFERHPAVGSNDITVNP